MNNTLTIQELQQLALEFGLPAIIRLNTVIICGQNNYIVFTIQENNLCHLLTC